MKPPTDADERGRTGRLSPRKLLNWAERQIGRSDAEFLFGTLLQRQRHELYEGREEMRNAECGMRNDNPETALPGARDESGASAIQTFVHMTRQVAGGRPVEYALRRACFMDFELYVDERVLIPRSETEELVGRTIDGIGRTGWILDVGTGSGAIAIGLARARPEARLLATDVSAEALEVAAGNVQRFGLEDRIELARADLFEGRANGSFDLIVANPPYVPTVVWETLDRSVREQEPRIALDGGPDGMRCARPILQHAARFLAAGGLLAMEIDPAISACIRGEFPCVRIERDWQGLDRFLFAGRDELPGGDRKRGTGERKPQVNASERDRNRRRRINYQEPGAGRRNPACGSA